MNNLRNIDSDLPALRNENLTNILVYGKQIYDDKTDQIISMHVIAHSAFTCSKFIIETIEQGVKYVQS